MGRRAVVVAAVAVVATAWPAVASGQAAQSATVTGVVDGDTLRAQVDSGEELTVGLLGVDAPDLRNCGGRDARRALERLAEGRAVALQADPAVGGLDDRGRSAFYVDRADGLDVGRELVRLGWATVVERSRFERRPDYREAAADADGGVWAACGGDFDLTAAEQRRAQRASARRFVRGYYRRVSSRQYKAAWRMLGAPARRAVGNRFRSWRAGFAGSRGVRVTASRARLKGRRAIVKVRLRAGARDVCSGRTVRQRFRGNVVLAQRGDSFVVLRFRIAKTSGGTPRRSKSECPEPEPKPSPQGPGSGTDCQGYSPCLPPGPDVDCAGGSGDGPRYVSGPVSVNGNDPYGLDSDGDGVGCES